MNTNYSFIDYEDAVIAALSDLKRENGGYLAELNGYAGQLDNATALKAWMGRFPAVTVAVPNADYPASGRTNIYCSQAVKVFIFVGAHSWRGQAAARGGAVGGAQILCDVRNRLLFKTLGLEISDCLLLRESVIASDLNSVLYAAEYQINNDRITEDLT